MQIERREEVPDGRRHVDAVAGHDDGSAVPVVLLVDVLDLGDDRRLVKIGSEPLKMKNRFEVRTLDEGKCLLRRPALGGVPWLWQLSSETIDLSPREKGQADMLGGMLEEHMDTLLLHGIDEQERVVCANQNLQLTQLVSRWWYGPEHEFSIGGRRESVKLV